MVPRYAHQAVHGRCKTCGGAHMILAPRNQYIAAFGKKRMRQESPLAPLGQEESSELLSFLRSYKSICVADGLVHWRYYGLDQVSLDPRLLGGLYPGEKR